MHIHVLVIIHIENNVNDMEIFFVFVAILKVLDLMHKKYTTPNPDILHSSATEQTTSKV